MRFIPLGVRKGPAVSIPEVETNTFAYAKTTFNEDEERDPLQYLRQ